MTMTKSAVIQLNESGFSKFISDKKNPLVVADFFAEWCGPCQIMAPIILKIAEKYPKVKFAKVNVDEEQKLSNKYEVSSIPCIIFFKDGKEVDRIIGALDEEVFEEKIKDYMKN